MRRPFILPIADCEISVPGAKTVIIVQGAISTRRADSERMSVVASQDHAGPLVEKMLDRLSKPNLQSMGSSLKFRLVAEGKADLYLRDLPRMEWDTAAAQCFVEAAGGTVYGFDGKRQVWQS